MLTTETSPIDIQPRASLGVRHRPQPARFGVRHGIALRIVDFLSIVLAGAIVLKATRIPIHEIFVWGTAQEILAIIATLGILLFESLGMYRQSFSTSARDEVYATITAFLMFALPALAILWFVPELGKDRPLVAGALLVGAGTLSLGRFFAHVARVRLFPQRIRNIVIAGTPSRVAAIPGELALTSGDRVQRFAVDSFDHDVTRVTLDGDFSRLKWLQYAVDNGSEEVIVTEALPPEIMPALLRITEKHGIRLAFAPTRIRPHACEFRIRRDGGLALMYPRSLTVCMPTADFAKRLFDIAIAGLALVVLAIPLALIALAVVLDSGRPIFYRQVRVGRLGETFEIIKFRTMRVDAEAASGPVWARRGEARTTRVGRLLRRTSLDELPQLFNVLRGEMSLVGPRPERPFYVEQFKKILPRYDERHLVRPGITGWSHINMRRNVDTSAIGERLSYDLFYLEHWSPFMDLLILCKTGAEFLFHSAA
jgi:exopolysaccharide biosynthesis polyprenyl glycosylphosphotransferase